MFTAYHVYPSNEIIMGRQGDRNRRSEEGWGKKSQARQKKKTSELHEIAQL